MAAFRSERKKIEMERFYSVYHYPFFAFTSGKWEEERFQTQEAAEQVAERLTEENPLVAAHVVLFEEIINANGEKEIKTTLIKEFQKAHFAEPKRKRGKK